MLFSKRILGIDIGTANIRVVELSGSTGKKKLENYGEMKTEALFERPVQPFGGISPSLPTREIAQAIKEIIEKAGMKANNCIFSIPDFYTFFTTFELPAMTKEELSQAVIYEAKQHIPLPLGKVTVDWEIIEGEAKSISLLKIGRGTKTPKGKEKLKILLVAVSNEVINEYQEIAKLSNLKLLTLEAEVFGLIRSLIPADKKRTVSIVDIGAQTTTCSIVDKGILRDSHSFDFSENDLTEAVITSLSCDYQTAEKIKQKYGLKDVPLSSLGLSQQIATTKEILLPHVNIILEEVKRIIGNFNQAENKEVQKIILAGGSANMPGLKEYCENFFKKEVEVANPFLSVSYSEILKKTLEEMGPSYAIAVGAALKYFG